MAAGYRKTTVGTGRASPARYFRHDTSRCADHVSLAGAACHAFIGTMVYTGTGTGGHRTGRDGTGEPAGAIYIRMARSTCRSLMTGVAGITVSTSDIRPCRTSRRSSSAGATGSVTRLAVAKAVTGNERTGKGMTCHAVWRNVRGCRVW